MKARFFVLGMATVVVIGLVVGFVVVKFGLIPANADDKPGMLEKRLANTALDAWTEREAEHIDNPFQPTPENLANGLKQYRSNCAECHGDGSGPSHFGQALYPPAPQWVEHGPHDDDRIPFYIAKHGIRLTGMPAFGSMMKDEELWQAVLFIKHIKDLPPDILQDYKTHHPHGS